MIRPESPLIGPAAAAPFQDIDHAGLQATRLTESCLNLVPGGLDPGHDRQIVSLIHASSGKGLPAALEQPLQCRCRHT